MQQNYSTAALASGRDNLTLRGSVARGHGTSARLLAVSCKRSQQHGGAENAHGVGSLTVLCAEVAISKKKGCTDAPTLRYLWALTILIMCERGLRIRGSRVGAAPACYVGYSIEVGVVHV